jgi:hypothetical protein
LAGEWQFDSCKTGRRRETISELVMESYTYVLFEILQCQSGIGVIFKK